MISFRLARLTTLNDRIAQRLVSRRLGISLREWRTLATLSYLVEATTAELARESFLDHAQVSRMAGGLVDRGLVRRSGRSGRGGVLRLTEAGSELVAKGMPHVAHYNDLLTAEMTETDRAGLYRLLDELMALATRRYQDVGGEIANLASLSALPGTDTPLAEDEWQEEQT